MYEGPCASHIWFDDCFIGTLVSAVRYAFTVNLFVDVLERASRDPSLEGALLLAAAFVGTLVLAQILDRAIRRYRRHEDDGSAGLADADARRSPRPLKAWQVDSFDGP